jgi:hypothetical protein
MPAGYKTSTVGGGPATGLANDWVKFLESGLNTGTFGTRGAAGGGAMDSTTGIAGVLNEMLGAGAGKFGDALQSIIGRQQQTDVANIHQRYGAASVGTPGGVAESLYRAQAAPQSALAIGNLQLKALEPLLAMINQTAQRGIPQAENVIQPGVGMSILGALPGLAGGAADIMKAVKMGGNSNPATPSEQSVSPDEWWSNFLNASGTGGGQDLGAIMAAISAGGA